MSLSFVVVVVDVVAVLVLVEDVLWAGQKEAAGRRDAS